VAAVPIHMPEAIGRAAVAEQDRHLVQALRRQAPEVPHHRRRLQVCLWISLLRMDEVAELDSIADEEHRRVVTYQVPVALFGVVLHRKPAGIALGVCRALLSADGREAQEHRSLLARLLKQLRRRVLRHVRGWSP